MTTPSRRCPVCGTAWGMTARWCGACGATLAAGADAPPRSDGPGPRRVTPQTWGVVVVVLVLGLVGLGTWATSGDGPAVSADGEVAVPGQEVLAEFDDADPDGIAVSSGSRMACAPAGCQVWRVDDPTGQDVLASDELVLHLRRDQTTAYDSTTGRVRWQRPTPGYAGRTARLTAIAPSGLAFVHTRSGGLAVTPSEESELPPVQVSLHDADDGSHRADVELGPGLAQQALWIGDRLVVVVASLDRSAIHSYGITPAGDVAWRRADTRAVRHVPGTTTLLVAGTRSVALLDVADGHARWEVPGSVIAPADLTGPLLVGDGDGHLQVADPTSGVVRRTIDLAGARAAVAFGPWVLVSGGDTVRVLDPATGERLFSRPDPTAPAAADDAGARPGLLRVSTAVQAGDRVVIAWSDATTDDGIELAVHGLDGTRQGTLTVPVDAVMGGAIGLHEVAGRDDVVLVHLTTGAGPEGSIAAVDTRAREVLGVADGRLIASDDDLLVIRRDDGLAIIGPTGQLQARHVRDVAALDPLVVHGSGGIMRLDRSLAMRAG